MDSTIIMILFFLANLEITYKYDWTFDKRNSRNYMTFTKSELDFDTGRTYFDLQNLFNGDKFLGKLKIIQVKKSIFFLF